MPELVALGLVDGAVSSLKEAGLEVVVFDKVKPEPSCTHVDEVAALVRESGAQVLVAFGGGSVMDVAKAAAIAATHPEPTWMYVNLSNRPPLDIEAVTLPVVVVSTTSGTGSEATPYAVMSNDETIQKGTIKSSYIFPRAAIVDPSLTLKLPPRLTAATGVDAFCHALESFINIPNRNAFSIMVASEAMRTLYKSLPAAVANGADLALREEVAWGSTLAGVAIANAGTTVAHGMAQPLGARAHLSHAETVAIFTVPVLRNTWQAATGLFAEIASQLDPQRVLGFSEEAAAEAGVDMVEEFFKEVGMFIKMKEFGVKEDILSDLVGDITGYMSRPLAQHPKVFNAEEVMKILKEAY